MTRRKKDDAAEHPRFLSREACAALTQRTTAMARGGGETTVVIRSRWTGAVRWARNEISTTGETRDTVVLVIRQVRGATGEVETNRLDDANLEGAVRRAERLLQLSPRDEMAELGFFRPYLEPHGDPPLWFDRTYQLDAAARAAAAQRSLVRAEAAGTLSAGYVAVTAEGKSIMGTSGLDPVYYASTYAQYSTTVRDPGNAGAGWAGVDWNDWGRVDGAGLSAIALEKCLTSRTPVAVEPGRYMTIFEPQAVCDLVAPLFVTPGGPMERGPAESAPPFMTFAKNPGNPGDSMIGDLVVDERISISADPMDPDLAFVPVGATGESGPSVYHAATWIEHGILKALAYPRMGYGVQTLRKNTGLPNSGAFRMSGGPVSVADMTAATSRGLLVTRLSSVNVLDWRAMQMDGYTRDGVWLIENGKISKPARNFRFLDSLLGALNRVEQLGPPQRVFRPEAPAIVPALKIRDFNFAALTDAF